MKKYYKRNWNNIQDYFLIIAIIISIGLIAYTNLMHYYYKMNADIASEAVLARLIWESGELIPKSWYTSTELKIWGTPNLAALLYGITKNSALAMGIACVLMTLSILLSAYFFISQFSFDKTQKRIFLLLCLIIPNHFIVLELFYLFAAYYAIHVIVMFFTLGVYAQLISGKQKNVLYMTLSIVLSFMMGMQGVRGILILSGPLFVTEILRQFYLIYSGNNLKDKRNLFVAGWCVLLPFAGYAGTLLPFSIKFGTSRNIRKGFTKLLETVFPDMTKCLGISNIGIIGSILYIGLLLAAMAIFVLFIIQLFKRQYNDNNIWIYLMLWISTVITMLVVAFTTTDSSQRYYFIIFFTLAFGVVNFTEYIKRKSYFFCNIGYLAVHILFVLHTIYVYNPIIQSDEPFQDTKYEVVKYLEDNGLQTGYASFEMANTMTVLSGGTIQISAVASVERMDMCKWLSSSDWYVPNVPYESRTAYIIMETEKDSFEKFYELHCNDLQFDIQIGQFSVYESNYNFSCLE